MIISLPCYEGFLSLSQDSLILQSNARGLQIGLDPQLIIPVREIIGIESRSLGNDGQLVFACQRDGFVLSVNYAGNERVRAAGFIAELERRRSNPVLSATSTNFAPPAPISPSSKKPVSPILVVGGLFLGFIILLGMFAPKTPDNNQGTTTSQSAASVSNPIRIAQSPTKPATPTAKPVPTATETPRQRRKRRAAERKQKEAERLRLAQAKEAEEEAARSAAEEQHKKDNPLELIGDDLKFTQGEYSGTITGRIRNNTDQTYSYAQITIGLYDDEDNQVGSTIDNVNGLEPGGIWKFEAQVLEDKASSCKVLEITGTP